MSETTPQPELSDSQINSIERYVDLLNCSYDEARRRVLDPTSNEEQMATPEKSVPSNNPRRRRGYNGPQYGEEEGVGTPDGLPAYFERGTADRLSDEQVITNDMGAQAVREALAAHQLQNGTYDNSSLARARRVAQEAKKGRH